MDYKQCLKGVITMEYKRFGQKILLRLNPGEEVAECIREAVSYTHLSCYHYPQPNSAENCPAPGRGSDSAGCYHCNESVHWYD